ncbi:MAG: hypothetical protein ACI4LK_02330 [Lentihominibacter sp.]
MAKKKKKSKNIGNVNFNTGKFTSSKNVKAKNKKDNVIGNVNFNTGKFTAYNYNEPKKKTTTNKAQNKRTWFQKGLFADGYDFGDITKTLSATTADIRKDATKGILKIGEGAIDTVAYGVQGVAKAMGKKELAKQTKDFIAQDLVEKYNLESRLNQSIKNLPGIGTFAGVNSVADVTNRILNGKKTEKRSLLGDKSDSLVQSGGTLAGTIGLQALGVPWQATMGATSFGSGIEEAYKGDATYAEAGIYGGITAASEILLEKLSGGIKFKGMKTLDEGVKRKLATTIANKTAKTLGKFGLDMVGEGTEEVLQEVVQNVGKKLTYEDDKTWKELLTSEEAMDGYLESFIGGAVLGGGFNVKRLNDSIKTGRDYDTGLTDNETTVLSKEVENRVNEKKKQAAVKAEVEKIIKDTEERTEWAINEEGRQAIKQQVQEKLDNGEIDYSNAKLSTKEIKAIETEVTNDLKKGYISVNAIEETLVPESTKKLQKLEAELKTEADPTKRELIQKDITEVMQARASELNGIIAKDNYLQESYRQENLSREAFTRQQTINDSDITKALEKSAKAAGLNNSRKSHEAFEFIDKISNDSGVQYAFTSNAQLKEMQSLKQLPEDIDVANINGFYRTTDKDGKGKVYINVDAQKAIDTIIGHETTHLFEGAKEYKALQQIAFEYAKTKGEYDSRLKDQQKLYGGVKGANVENELTSDLVGDYLFTDEQFVRELSAKQPNVFKRIYEYISTAVKKATAGSKEERQLIEFKQKYKKLYREISKVTTKEGKTNSLTEVDSNTPDYVKFSLVKDKDTLDFLNAQENKGVYAPDLSLNGNELIKDLRTPREGVVVVYRAAVKIDGKYYPPMATDLETNKQTRKKGERKELKRQNPSVLDEWEVAEEHPEYAVQEKGKSYLSFVLNKDNGTSLTVAYNPYIHSSLTPLNDQFKSAYSRDNLVVLKGYVPLSEMSAENPANREGELYKAEGAKDSVGPTTGWNSGAVSKELKKNGNPRVVLLSRYFKPVEEVPVEEVADIIIDKMLKTTDPDFAFPYNVVTPQLGKALEDRGLILDERENKSFPLKSEIYPDIKYSLSAKDNEYMKAVRDGDTVKAQKMVDEAAKAAGYTIKAYHGTGYNFTVFDKNKQGQNYEDWGRLGKGFYFAPDEKWAGLWADKSRGNNTKVMGVYLKDGKIIDAYEALPENLVNTIPEDWDQLTKRLATKYTYNYVEYMQEFGYDVQKIFLKHGYDGIAAKDTEYVMFNPEHIKSADPVTYDDNGNIVPLSERFNEDNQDIRFSLSDSKGRKLSAGQQEYFKDSKVRDENGNLKTVYHGTNKAGFTVFNRTNNFYTDSKDVAGTYTNKDGMYEGYLNITKPIEIDADGERWSRIDVEQVPAEVRDLFDEYGISTFEEDGAERTSTADIVGAIEDGIDEGRLDYDGIIFSNIYDEGMYGGAKPGTYKSDVYVTFSSNQFKNIDNLNPTDNQDIRFSLSKPVEETKELLAIHNLSVEKLKQTLELGGLPMPSIAIAKAQQGHENFGEVSLVLNKEAIDPKASKANVVYSGDAYTPTFPRVDYKVNTESEDRLAKRVKELSSGAPDSVKRTLNRYGYGQMEYQLNNWGGESGLIESLLNDSSMKQVYLNEKGQYVEDVIKRTETKLNPFEIQKYETLISELGKDVIESIKTPEGKRPRTHRVEWFNEHGEALKAAYGKALKAAVPELTDKDVADIVSSAKTMELLEEVRGARNYIVNGDTTYKEEFDYPATIEEINRRTDEADYRNWLNELFGGIEEAKGIRNEKDTFTPSGNRRSFNALHYEYNLENIVKAMKKEEAQGKNTFGGGNIRGAAAEKLGSIAEIKQRSDLLQAMTDEEYSAAKRDFDARFMELADSLAKNSMGSSDAAALLVEAVVKNKTKSGMASYIQREGEGWTDYSDYIVDDLVDLVNDIRKMPTTYFEAKPRRAVNFNEIYTALIPNNTPEEVRAKLGEYGINTVEYESGNKADRLEKLNSMEGAMFSLGSPSQDIAPYGRIWSKDIKLQDKEVAPVKETAPVKDAPVKETAPVNNEIAPVKPIADDYLDSRPLTEEDLPYIEQANADAFANIPVNDFVNEMDMEEVVNEMDMEAVSQRWDEIYDEEARLRKAVDNDEIDDSSYEETFDYWNNLTREKALLGKRETDIATTEKYLSENYYQLESPLEKEGRDMKNVGSRKVKAYMYENPEVKPFFQQEAEYMLGDLHSSIKGERHHEPHLYYITNGEEGWWGTKRFTTPEIAALLDNFHYTYADIEKGLEAIIKDDGAENIAVAKRIEFMLDERLREGYESIDGYEIPPNQEYLNFLAEKNITEYTDDAFNDYDWESLLKTIPDDIAPIAPITEGGVDYITNLMREKGVNEADVLNQYGVESLYDLTRPQYMEAVDNLTNDIAPVKGQLQYNTETGQVENNPADRPKKLNKEQFNREYKTTGEVAPTEGIQQRFNTETGKVEDVKEDVVTRTRKELRKELIEDNRSFFIRAMNDAKNRSMALLNNTDTVRVQELVFGREAGNKINSLIFQNEIDNEARSIAWQNKQRKIIKDLGIKPRSKMSAAVQKYGEKQYMNEYGDFTKYDEEALQAEFPDVKDQVKIRNAAATIRNLYDEYIDMANVVLTDLGFDPINKREDYMRHFSELTDVFSTYGIPFNPKNMQEHLLPTDINGITDTFSPQKNFFANMQPRKGLRTNLDAITGIDGYISGISNLIFHTEDIQRGRAFEELIRETYGQEKGLENAEVIESLTEEELLDRIDKINNNHLSNYAAWVHEWTNGVAGKKNKVDRAIESVFGRKAFTFVDEVRKQVGANMIGLNISSSLTNLIAPVQALSKTQKLAFAKGTVDTFRNIFVKDGFVDKNAFLTSRFGTDMVSKTAWDKVRDVAYVFMKGVDYFSSNLIVRSKYHELRSKGMSEKQAHAEAGKFAARIMGDRTKGANALLFDSKLLGLVTQFQLEVNNQVYAMFYDTYHESKEQAKGSAAKTAAGMTLVLGQLTVFTHLFGKAFESLAGYNPTFDIIGIIATALGLGDDDEDKTPGERLEAASLQLLKALPYTSTFTGGRVPIGSALPIKQFVTGKDDYNNDKSRLETLAEALPYYVLPGGYGQIKKTTQGLGMFSNDNPVPGSYTDSGNLRFPVEETPENIVKAAIFGQWASKEARDYFDNERLPLKEKQIQEYKDLNIPIQDYWDIREGLSKQKTLEDKFDYVSDLDLPVKKKNILINNVVDRKEKVNLKDYDSYSSLEEFDFANKYPKKYKFLQNNGISWKEYNSSEEAKDAYNWAYKNKEGFAIAKAVTGDVVSYRAISGEIYDIKSDKDSSGKSISGSRKAKIIDYLNNSDLPYEAKLILFKKEYNSDDEHNNEIIDYLNNREDISYTQMKRILTGIGFEVDNNGTIRW